MTTLIEAYCPDCAELGAFEQPPCVDGHGADCPEWLCLSCGTALLIDMPAIDMPVEQPRGTLRARAA